MAAQLVGGAFLSAFLQVLFDRLASREVVDFFRGKEPIVKLLNELNTALFSAGLLLSDAEEKLIKDRKVKKWLDELKETVYDADDLVYKINTEALRNELEGRSQSSLASKVLMKLKPTSFTTFDEAIKPKIDEILGKLKLLLEQKKILGLENVKAKLPERLYAPLVQESNVYGRNVDKEAIIKLLLLYDASDAKLSVIPIVGMGGIGKTTLAQIVYNDERVNKRFDIKAWVTVGDGKVDCLKVLKTIIKNVSNSKEYETEELYDLQSKVKAALTGKKFIFVLDDIWDEDPHKWDVLKSSFESGLRGSMILATTRSGNVASVMETGLIHQLDRISDDDGWRLFAKHALINVDYSDEYSDLQVIGKKIVDKCKGLPLAIKSLGDLLRRKRNKNEWIHILNSDIWELNERSRIGILPALWLSYYYLPSELKPCFAYCALFPKGYKFVKEKIILLWMAEGFLHPENGKNMEEIGEEYFQDLISRSFFQPSREGESALLMHDLMHDLAIFVSGHEFCLEIDDNNFSNYACKIHHLLYRRGANDPKKLEGLSEAKGLRTFLTLLESKSDKQWSLQIEHFLDSLLLTGSCLRVLAISGCNIIKLPDSIGDLKYLKYLDLSFTQIEEIPDIVCNLYNLQTLLLKGCDRLTRMPTKIGNLINLRHLQTPPYLEDMPLQIGKMKNLQTLSNFVVGKNSKSGIKLLKELQDLHGTLEISGLENVDDVKDVSDADLKNKKFLSALNLVWPSSHVLDDSQKEREVLAALKPHANLKELFIECYQGTSFPNWVGDHLFSNVTKISLHHCKNCCFLPPLGQLPSLKHLVIRGFSSVERIASEFYSSADSPGRTKPFRSLESLRFEFMSNLQEWSFIEGKVEGGIFPRLRELYFGGCPKLIVSIPDYLPSLRKLEIFNCDQLMPLLPRAQSQQMNAAFPSLEILDISNCGGQDLLLEGGLPSSLKQICIFGCWNLTILDEEAFQRLTFLEKLEISQCDNIMCLPRGLPTSLSYLSIEDCDPLLPRLQRETGEDWPIIAHIPSVTIFPNPDDGYFNAQDEDEDYYM
ncbi:NB-ARC domain, LRR domain containing protein [Trema orientale]|uniref:NB-ARC domain, LRR domain containing protein n=1 Tax=Trema orientale TaxID=63057 RepID=A0A2P5AN37_TREOI|nr:NB-ARC domain, LRR domain containing protein [Trema orientale]